MPIHNKMDANDFVARYREEQQSLRDKLQSYWPLGTLRESEGRFFGPVRDTTAERVANIRADIASLETKIAGVIARQPAVDRTI
jgi:hypothetical protein